MIYIYRQLQEKRGYIRVINDHYRSDKINVTVQGGGICDQIRRKN